MFINEAFEFNELKNVLIKISETYITIQTRNLQHIKNHYNKKSFYNFHLINN